MYHCYTSDLRLAEITDRSPTGVGLEREGAMAKYGEEQQESIDPSTHHPTNPVQALEDADEATGVKQGLFLCNFGGLIVRLLHSDANTDVNRGIINPTQPCRHATFIIRSGD